MKRNLKTSQPLVQRHGFSLMEILIVISIIGILMAIILPAIGGVRYRVQVAAVTAEMSQLDQALGTFNNKFGTYPPSSITLHYTQAEWDLDPTGMSAIRSIWPDFDFSTGGRGDPLLDPPHPWGIEDKELTGDECLVFFLGGMADYPTDGDVPTLRGFSKNSKWPLSMEGENRDGPFYSKFDVGRLTDIDGDKIPVFRDSLPGQKTALWYSVATSGRYEDGDKVYFQSDAKTPWNKESCQIISPGMDGEFGVIEKTPTNQAVYKPSTDFSTRKLERDNITNFSGGLLER